MNQTSISKHLARVLRHKPEEIGVTLDAHGWACVEDILHGLSINQEILDEIVCTDLKQRYTYNEEKTKIRANQGHSIPVDVQLEQKLPPIFLYHGTGKKYVASIDQEGLKPKSRLYVHLSKDIQTAIQVGSRHGIPFVYRINTQRMIQDGYIFYISKNGVWLTSYVPIQYLEKVKVHAV